MDWLGVFASNLAGGLFWPFIGLTVFAAGVLIWSVKQKQIHKYASAEYTTAGWAQHTAVQGTVIMWLVWAILNAVPEPNYTVIEKKVEVVKKVDIGADFSEAYDSCLDATWRKQDGELDDKQITMCKETAEQLVLGQPRVVEKIVKEPVLAPAEERYRTLFNTCMGADVVDGGWSVDDKTKDGLTGTELRQERIKLCHAQTKEIVRG